eukprot:CAMPEP_0179076610 /NCGR_PEP_ID=MMETSP0796-20121207/34189_1 /TAXON_ID=73915 /ORGANISM="Pyrodinium bahamense, Strain pbaha01" /LENGTH=764 /DNA_ID=CAMNT_0020773867 /DNA_START=59 /DNA_END=2353 /DNA_ORIENTATION=+
MHGIARALLLLLGHCSHVHGERHELQTNRLTIDDAASIPLNGKDSGVGLETEHVVSMGGFHSASLNAVYSERSSADYRVNSRSTFWNENGYFIYWCSRLHEWRVSPAGYWNNVSQGQCVALATKKPRKLKKEVPSGHSWHERYNKKWVLLRQGGVTNVGRACSSYESEGPCKIAQEGCRWSSSKGQCTAEWQLFGPDGPKFTDVNQGALGTCYFLAALAAVAYRHPEVIADLFVQYDAWSVKGAAFVDLEYPVYVVKFLLTGMPVLVAVDEMFPVSPQGKPVFVKYSDSLNLWPMVLEKAWAKVFGSFKGVEAGVGPEAFKAITQAPVDYLRHDAEGANVEEVWSALLDGVQNNYPMYAASKPNVVGIPQGHAYAVLDAGWAKIGDADARTVRLYNPWSRSQYRGNVTENDLRTGHFRMLLEEFIASFRSTCIAKVRKGYVLSYKVLTKGATSLATRLELEVKDDEPFAVQLEWPSGRLSVRGGCERLTPRIIVEVVKDGASVKATQTQERKRAGVSNVRADLPGGAGTYVVDVRADFPKGTWVDEVVLNTYARSKIAISDAGPLPEQPLGFVTLSGLTSPKLNGRYIERRDDKWRINGRETYWAANGYYMFWCKTSARWTIVSGSFDKNKNGKCIAQAQGPVGADVCQVDIPKNFREYVKGKWVTEPLAGVSSNSNSAGSLLQESEVQDVNKETCKQVLQRLHTLNNQDAIAAAQFDDLFPPNMTSIAQTGTKCGDTAAGIHESCGKFDRWRPLFDIMGDAAR